MAFILRMYFAFILSGVAICWALYKGVIKKDWKAAKEILSLALFFGGIWFLIFYFLILK